MTKKTTEPAFKYREDLYKKVDEDEFWMNPMGAGFKFGVKTIRYKKTAEQKEFEDRHERNGWTVIRSPENISVVEFVDDHEYTPVIFIETKDYDDFQREFTKLYAKYDYRFKYK